MPELHLPAMRRPRVVGTRQQRPAAGRTFGAGLRRPGMRQPRSRGQFLLPQPCCTEPPGNAGLSASGHRPRPAGQRAGVGMQTRNRNAPPAPSADSATPCRALAVRSATSRRTKSAWCHQCVRGQPITRRHIRPLHLLRRYLHSGVRIYPTPMSRRRRRPAWSRQAARTRPTNANAASTQGVLLTAPTTPTKASPSSVPHRRRHSPSATGFTRIWHRSAACRATPRDHPKDRPISPYQPLWSALRLQHSQPPYPNRRPNPTYVPHYTSRHRTPGRRRRHHPPASLPRPRLARTPRRRRRNGMAPPPPYGTLRT